MEMEWDTEELDKTICIESDERKIITINLPEIQLLEEENPPNLSEENFFGLSYIF